MRRLLEVEINGLLGRFSHTVTIPDDWEFVILHGPNGVGKTRFLEVIANTLGFRAHTLLDQPFERARFAFSDGVFLEVSKGADEELPFSTEDAPPVRRPKSLTYVLSGFAPDAVSWTLTRGDESAGAARRLRELERFLPIEQVGPDAWLDMRMGDHVSLADILDRYGSEIPFDTLTQPNVPSELREFLDQCPVHLIETQRLLTFDRRPPQRAQAGAPRRPTQRSTVLEYADDLTRRIAGALAQNSRTSQELDRTFPRRVLNIRIPNDVTDEEIQRRYADQTELRRRLAEIAVLDRSDEMPLPAQALQDWQRRVLWTYLEDSEKKLSTFQTLLDRVRLLREIVNSRFLFKELVIDAEKGFRFVSDQGPEVGPTQLSSGEQHELVLLYALLFNVPANALVLVDEPEISLHVAWQQQFLNDIQRIAALADLQFVIATHSPQVIHTWWDRAVPLYDARLDDGRGALQ